MGFGDYFTFVRPYRCPIVLDTKNQVVMWRAFQEILPLFNLNQRGGHVIPHCPRCKEHDETGLHAIFLCDSIRDIWIAAGYEDLVNGYSRRSVAGFLLSVYLKLLKSQLELFCVLAYYSWFERNILPIGKNIEMLGRY